MDTFLSKFSKDPEYGDNVNLRCDSGGIPTPQITWWFDSKELKDGSKYTVKVSTALYICIQCYSNYITLLTLCIR